MNKIIEKAKMIHTIVKSWPIISAIAVIAAKVALVILIIILIMVPFMYLSDIIEAVGTGLDKFINFTIGEGFKKSEEVFFLKLDEEYVRYRDFSHDMGELDIPLLSATVHYFNYINPEGYDDENVSEEEYTFDDNDYVVETSQIRNFYVVAVDELGSAYTLIRSQQGLLGHLVDTRFESRCVGFSQGAFGKFKDFFGFFSDQPGEYSELSKAAKDLFNDFALHLGYTVEDTIKDVIKYNNVLHLIRLIYAYNQEGQSYFTKQLSTIYDEDLLENIYRIMTQSYLVSNCSEGEIAFPVMVKFMNYNRYKDYLRDNYLPRQSYNEHIIIKSKEEQEIVFNRQIDEIFDQRDAFAYLMNKSDGYSGGQYYINVIFTDGVIDVMYFNQDDPRWANYPYIYPSGRGNISRWGCGPTSLAIVISSLLGKEVTPINIVDKFCPAYCTSNGSYGSMMIAAPEYYGLKSIAVSRTNSDLQRIINALSQGSLVVAHMGPGDFTKGGHYIVLRGVTSSGQVLVADPKVEKRCKEWDFELIVRQTKATNNTPFWIISK